MSLRPILAVALSIFCIRAFAAPADDARLLEAATAGDRAAVSELLARGASPSASGRGGVTALMLAADRHDFETAKLLLWAGAKASATDDGGRAALEHLNQNADGFLPINLLIRCYVLMQREGKVTPDASRPSLVICQENTVDYNHPDIKGLYYVNNAELKGKAKADDDGNGFVDDVYGWNIASNQPHVFHAVPVTDQTAHDQLISSLFKLNDAAESGSSGAKRELEELKDTYSNPLFEFFGPRSDFSDYNYLKLVADLSHGTHVAGIVAATSHGKAQLHTMAWMPFQKVTKPQTDQVKWVEELAAKAKDRQEFYKKFRERRLLEAIESGRIASRYVHTTGAGVVNMSFNINQEEFLEVAKKMFQTYLATHEQQSGGPNNNLKGNFRGEGGNVRGEGGNVRGEGGGRQQQALTQEIYALALDLYVAVCVEHVFPIYENPNVLFVAAAGNDKADNDNTLAGPAYLSRFFPNFISVAAVDDGNRLATFSNFGRRSVNVAAPGVSIRSCGVAGQKLLMSGTSMAAPAVSGLAAEMRSANPKVSASKVRTILEDTVTPVRQLRGMVSSGGVVNPSAALTAAKEVK